MDTATFEAFDFEFDFLSSRAYEAPRGRGNAVSWDHHIVHYEDGCRAASSGFAKWTPVIPPGYRPIPGYEAFRLIQQARALAGPIALRRGMPLPAPIWTGDDDAESVGLRW